MEDWDLLQYRKVCSKLGTLQSVNRSGCLISTAVNTSVSYSNVYTCIYILQYIRYTGNVFLHFLTKICYYSCILVRVIVHFLTEMYYYLYRKIPSNNDGVQSKRGD